MEGPAELNLKFDLLKKDCPYLRKIELLDGNGLVSAFAPDYSPGIPDAAGVGGWSNKTGADDRIRRSLTVPIPAEAEQSMTNHGHRQIDRRRLQAAGMGILAVISVSISVDIRPLLLVHPLHHKETGAAAARSEQGPRQQRRGSHGKDKHRLGRRARKARDDA